MSFKIILNIALLLFPFTLYSSGSSDDIMSLFNSLDPLAPTETEILRIEASRKKEEKKETQVTICMYDEEEDYYCYDM